MQFSHRITWYIGLNRRGVPYPAAEAIAAMQYPLRCHGIDGFTVQHGQGFWKGEPEDCLIVSVLVNWPFSQCRASGSGIAVNLATMLEQEAVAWAVDALPAGGLAFAQG